MSKNNQQVRVRFAPSPTGAPHVGNIRTALFAWLYARHTKGVFIVRIEDTDQTRKEEGSIEFILEALAWLGLDIDEGATSPAEEKGDKGPYTQSKRLDIYQKYAKVLVEKKHAFYCFCSQERLRVLRELQASEKKPPKYDGKCLSLKPEQISHKLEQGDESVIRMKVPEKGETQFDDAIKGTVKVENSTIDYQVLLKSDGFPTYHLASVVDDHLMQISHVLRADEWLASTPKHILLYTYFGWEAPQFVHLPIVLGTDKSKLSKRHGAVSILDFKKQGYLADAVVNYLALLGWNPKTEQEVLNRDELIEQFSLEKINKNNPIFDSTKLNWLNKQYIKAMPSDLQMRAISQYSSRLRALDQFKQKSAVELVEERLEKFSDFDGLTNFLWKDEPNYEPRLLIPKKLNSGRTREMLGIALTLFKDVHEHTWSAEYLRSVFLEYSDTNKIPRGDLLWPLRVAITGLEHSPDGFLSMEILGKNKSVERVNRAIALLGG